MRNRRRYGVKAPLMQLLRKIFQYEIFQPGQMCFLAGLIQQHQFGRSEAALADLDRALALRPKSTATYRYRADVQAALGNDDRAIADFSKAHELDPNDPETYNSRGIFLFNKKRAYQFALKDFDRAIELNPTKGRYYLNRSRCYSFLGNNLRALEEARRAVERGEAVDLKYLASIQTGR